MSLARFIENIIQDAQERGEFENLKNKGKPLDLSAYFETPEEVRLAYSVLKSADMVSGEVELLNEIAVLKERLSESPVEAERGRIQKMLLEKQLQFNIQFERQKQKRKNG